MVEDGYEFFAKRQLVTLFSAPNYCGEFDNAGAMMSVDETLMCSFQVEDVFNIVFLLLCLNFTSFFKKWLFSAYCSFMFLSSHVSVCPNSAISEPLLRGKKLSAFPAMLNLTVLTLFKWGKKKQLAPHAYRSFTINLKLMSV